MILTPIDLSISCRRNEGIIGRRPYTVPLFFFRKNQDDLHPFHDKTEVSTRHLPSLTHPSLTLGRDCCCLSEDDHRQGFDICESLRSGSCIIFKVEGGVGTKGHQT